MFSMGIIAASINFMLDFESPNLDLYSSSYGPFLELFNGLCPNFGTVRGLVSELSSELLCGLLWLVVWIILWVSLCHNWS